MPTSDDVDAIGADRGVFSALGVCDWSGFGLTDSRNLVCLADFCHWFGLTDFRTLWNLGSTGLWNLWNFGLTSDDDWNFGFGLFWCGSQVLLPPFPWDCPVQHLSTVRLFS